MSTLNFLHLNCSFRLSSKRCWCSKKAFYFALMLLTLGSCIKKNESGSDAAGVKPIVLRLGHDADDTSAVHRSAMMLASRVETESKGRLRIEVYPSQKLGTDHAMIEMARVGELDLIIPPTSKLASVAPGLLLFDLPFLFENLSAFEKVLGGHVGQKLLHSADEKGLVGLGFWYVGGKHFTGNFPIAVPKDFQTKTIRVMRSPVIVAQFEAMGAQTRQIDFYEMYQALKDKTVDGQENPLKSIYDQKFYEVQSHLTLSNHAYFVQMLAASKKTMSGLPEDLRKIIIDAGKIVSLEEKKLALDDEVSALDLLRKTPINISELTPEARAEFRSVMIDLVHQFEDEIGQDILLAAMEDAGINVPKDESIVIALDADLSGKSAVSGQAIFRGMRLAADDINIAGGIHGKKIRVIALDHEAVAARSEVNLRKLVSRENVKAVFGGLQSAIMIGELASIQELSQAGKIYVVPWATAEAVVQNSLAPNPVFRLSAHDKLTGPFLAREAAKKSKKVALLLENSSWGRGNEVSMTVGLKALGLKPRAVEFFNVGEKEFVSHFKKIEDGGAEVILMAANPAEAKEIVKTLVTRPKRLPIIAHWGFTGGTFGKDLATELQSVDLKFLQTVAFLGNNRPQARVVAKKYLSKFGGSSVEDIDAAAGVARSYDAMRLVGLALKALKTNSKLSLVKAMENISTYEGIVTSYKYPFKGQREAIDSSIYRLGMYDFKGRIIPAGVQK